MTKRTIKATARLAPIDPVSASVWTCSNCKCETLAGWDDEIEKPKFCGECGAKFTHWERDAEEGEI